VDVPDVFAKTLVRAAEIAGGEMALAERLKVVPSHLHLWIRGVSQPPTHIFLAAVDLIEDKEQTRNPSDDVT
jgi:DNA-binding transcriptional regulator YdaS (Cro superfamily)